MSQHYSAEKQSSNQIGSKSDSSTPQTKNGLYFIIKKIATLSSAVPKFACFQKSKLMTKHDHRNDIAITIPAPRDEDDGEGEELAEA